MGLLDDSAVEAGQFCRGSVGLLGAGIGQLCLGDLLLGPLAEQGVYGLLLTAEGICFVCEVTGGFS